MDVFEMVASTNKPIKELVNQEELLIFCKYDMDAKDIKWFLEWWWRKHEIMFPTFGLLAILYILMIVSFQFEIGRIFSFVGILVNLRICHLQL